ncbi:MAG: YbjN domain-containing protein [Algoriphagus sp.]|nr:YbjN domain-containing protein [Algoriphagus sp.]
MTLEAIHDFLVKRNVKVSLKSRQLETLEAYLELFFKTKEEENFVMEIGYIPDLEEEVDTFRLLQFVVPVLEITADYPKYLDSILHFMNCELVTPGFVCDPQSGLVYFRYVMPLSKDESKVDLEQLIEILQLIFFQVKNYAPKIRGAVSE